MFSAMDAIPSPIQTALDLFETALAEVRFADIDAKTLARAAADVQAIAAVVATAQASLDSARCALQERQNALYEQVQRALAYARVYAENDDELSERLNAIPLPQSRPARLGRVKEDGALVLSSAPPRAGRVRGRPRKTPHSDAKLVDMTRESDGDEDKEASASATS